MPEARMQSKVCHDISIIRPQIRGDDFRLRGRDAELARLRSLRKGLVALHTLELMAMTIYRFQITRDGSELNRQLIAAMCNEMTHYQDFQIKLYEYGFRPNIARWLYWVVGFALGFCSRLLGRKVILKTGIWVETKAVRHYARLLESITWDEDTRNVIEKDQADEDGHISRWKNMLEASQ